MSEENVTCNKSQIEVTPEDLPLYCPTPEMSLWNAHPRVYLPIEQTGQYRCPYCGTMYVLRGGPIKSGGH